MFIRVCGGRKKSEKFVSTKGTITISSNVTGASIKVLNGAEVVAEGVTDGTPFTTKVLPGGTYTVVVSKEGFEDVTKNVVVNGDVSESIELTAGVLNVASIKAVNALGEKTDLDGATVSRASSFELTLDRAFDAASVTNSTIKLVKGSETMAISLPTIDKDVIAFKSLSVLDPDAEYKVVVDGIKSEKGTAVITNRTIATFKTTNTVVTKKITANGQKIYDSTTDDGVSLNVDNEWTYGDEGSDIEVKFDTPVDKSTINSKSVQLIDVTDGKNIAVEANQDWYSESMYIKVVGAKDYLTPKHQYKLVLNGLKAANGADIDAFALTFAYKSAKPKAVNEADIYNGDLKKVSEEKEGLVNPLTTAKMLDDGSTFKAAAAVTIDFGAAEVRLDESTVTTDYLFIREKDTHNRVAQKISYNKDLNRVTLTPTERLKDNSDYEIFESPYIKNIYGVTLGTKDSDYKTTSFKTLDVTAPTVVGQPESTLEDKSLSKLPLDETVKINVKMSEKIRDDITLAKDAKEFATGGREGNVLITRADDEKSVVAGTAVEAKKATIGKDDYVQLTINPKNFSLEKGETLKGKTFRVTLAGTNPSRKNDKQKVIADDYTISNNAMANDYTFTFTFEGEDKTAPKITDIKVKNGKDYTSIQGMTNVKLNDPDNKIRVYFDCKDVDKNATVTLANAIKLYKGSKDYPATIGDIVENGSTSYVDITYPNATTANVKGSVSIKAQDIMDKSGNKSSLQTFDFVAGDGPSIDKVKFDKPDESTSEDSYVKITFNKPEDIDTTTLAGNIKLLNGDKEVKTTIDTSRLLEGTTDKPTEKGYIKVVPSEKLSGNTKYTLVVSKNVKNNDGNCLQQNPNVAPADYKVDITTDDDAKPAIKGDVTFKDGKLLVPFDTKLKEVTSVKVTNSKDNSSVTAKASVKDDVNVEITFENNLTKNVQYNVELTVTKVYGNPEKTIVNTVTTSFVPTDNYEADLRKPVSVSIVKGNGTALTAGKIKDVNTDAQFTVEFSHAVAVNAVKAMKFVDAATKTEYTPEVIALDTVKDSKNNEYAKKYVIDIPGVFTDKNIEFRATLPGGTSVKDGEDVKKTDADIKLIVITNTENTTPATGDNHSPTVGKEMDDIGSDVPIKEEKEFEFTSFNDEDEGDTISYTVSSSDDKIATASIEQKGGKNYVKITPAANADGTVQITLTGTDPIGASISDTFDVTVDTKAPTNVGQTPAAFTEENKKLTITFDENILSALDESGYTNLKNAITFAADGTNFAALSDEDTVEVSGKTLIIAFKNAQSGENNTVKIAAGALKDTLGNVTTDEITTGKVAVTE
ncbi:MAG: PEGA domain-containing protein [Lachnospiraceae bacterium]|nr:PEGA domain-containing protein [Lachnospiraceae bacterium]